MEKHFYQSTGVSLVTGALLMILTMVVHPFGGSMEYILKISKSIMLTHALAICSLPVVLFGFYGLSSRLMDKWRLSMLAFIIMSFGLVAAMFAALFNGLTVPYFLSKYADQLKEKESILEPIVNFSFAINKPLDYIFITACCLAIVIYSINIIRSSKFSIWIGYLGLCITAFAITGALTDFVFTSLTGFRIFVFGVAGWVLSCGVSLFKSKIA